jgi:hypothetical protein
VVAAPTLHRADPDKAARRSGSESAAARLFEKPRASVGSERIFKTSSRDYGRRGRYRYESRSRARGGLRVIGLDRKTSEAYETINCDLTSDQSVHDALETLRARHGAEIAAVVHRCSLRCRAASR